MNNRGGNGKQKAHPTRGKPMMIQPGKLGQQNAIRRNLSNTRSLGRSSPPPNEPPAPTNNIVAPAETPSPIYASTPEAFVFMPNPSINLQTMGASSQHTPHEAPVAEDVPDEDDEDEDHDEEDEDEVGEGPVPPPVPRRDGKVIVRPFAKGLIPSKEVADASRFAIQSSFDEAIYDWSATTEDIRKEWFKKFGEKVTWDPCYNHVIQHLFEQKTKKRLNDMLTKVRKKSARPGWMREKAYLGLQEYWGGQKFKDLSNQNKVNRASTRGGAVHTSGRKAHVDLALELCNEYNRDVRPDELFLITHKKKSGVWVDHRAETTYDTYKQNVVDLVGDDVQEVDGAVAVECWTLAAGPPTRGCLYGTAGLFVNARPGSKSLIQESQNPFGFMFGISLEAEREARLRAEKIAQDAVAQAQEANERSQKCQNDLDEMKRLFLDRLDALERGSCGASHSHSHPHYDEDLDEDSLDGET